MKLRQSFLPKGITDFTACSFLFLMIPLIYWFEVFVVLPDYYKDGSVIYNVHFGMSIFLLVNLVGNLLAAIMIDSSIKGEIMPSALRPKWKFCDVCECVTPPRSWHCSVCNICILKRDHHCNFTACCIGHKNQRYFVMFLFYLTVSTAYATFFNGFYVWKSLSVLNFMNFMKIMFPLAIFVTGIDASVEQCYRLLCIVTIIGLTTASALFVYHASNVIKGRVMYEKKNKITIYNVGDVKSNLKLVFGKRWLLTFFSPFVTSELPHDGIHWEEIEQNSELQEVFRSKEESQQEKAGTVFISVRDQ